MQNNNNNLNMKTQQISHSVTYRYTVGYVDGLNMFVWLRLFFIFSIFMCIQIQFPLCIVFKITGDLILFQHAFGEMLNKLSISVLKYVCKNAKTAYMHTHLQTWSKRGPYLSHFLHLLTLYCCMHLCSQRFSFIHNKPVYDCNC